MIYLVHIFDLRPLISRFDRQLPYNSTVELEPADSCRTDLVKPAESRSHPVAVQIQSDFSRALVTRGIHGHRNVRPPVPRKRPSLSKTGRGRAVGQWGCGGSHATHVLVAPPFFLRT